MNPRSFPVLEFKDRNTSLDDFSTNFEECRKSSNKVNKAFPLFTRSLLSGPIERRSPFDSESQEQDTGLEPPLIKLG